MQETKPQTNNNQIVPIRCQTLNANNLLKTSWRLVCFNPLVFFFMLCPLVMTHPV